MRRSAAALAACALAGILTAFAPARAPLRLFLIGDSTVADYPERQAPMTGWGQVIGLFFGGGSVTVINRAIGGRSTRSFIEEGRWNTVRNELGPGDFLLVQFGHNDRSTVPERHADTAQYRRYLTQYVDEARARGAVPVLVTPMNMNAWNGATLRRVFTEGADDYRAAMLRVAAARKVPLIDLEKKSAELFQALGREYISRFLFMSLQPGEYPNYPDGLSDGTHFQGMGALEMARLVAEGIRELAPDTSMRDLADRLGTLVPLTVISDKPEAGLVTRGGRYPPKASITLKAMPKSGETFLGWAAAGFRPASTAARTEFSMPDAPAVWHASFRGGTTGLSPGIQAAVPTAGKATFHDAAGRASRGAGPGFLRRRPGLEAGMGLPR